MKTIFIDTKAMLLLILLSIILIACGSGGGGGSSTGNISNTGTGDSSANLQTPFTDISGDWLITSSSLNNTKKYYAITFKQNGNNVTGNIFDQQGGISDFTGVISGTVIDIERGDATKVKLVEADCDVVIQGKLCFTYSDSQNGGDAGTADLSKIENTLTAPGPFSQSDMDGDWQLTGSGDGWLMTISSTGTVQSIDSFGTLQGGSFLISTDGKVWGITTINNSFGVDFEYHYFGQMSSLKNTISGTLFDVHTTATGFEYQFLGDWSASR